MADRAPPYQMLPGYNATILQQQQAQLQQQQAHQQQSQQQGQPQQHQDQHPGMNQPTMEQARAWQMQMQQRFAQNPGGEMTQANSAQLAEFMKRSQSMNPNHLRQQQLAQAQQQQQQQQHLQQQQQQQQAFSLGAAGMPQMGNGGPVLGANSQQQPPFHDSQSNHPQQPHLPPGFPNMGGMPNGAGNAAAVAAAASLQARNSANLMQGSQAAARQLELMTMAQSQQPQNGPLNLAKFGQQQQQQMREQQQQQFPPGMNQSSSGEMLSSPGMSADGLRRPSPHPNNIQQAQAIVQGAQGQAQLSVSDVNHRIGMLRPAISSQETMIGGLLQQLGIIRGTNPPQEAALITKIKQSQLELKRRRDYLQQLQNNLHQRQQQQMQQHQGGDGGGPGPNQGGPWMTNQPFEPPNAQGQRPQMGQVPGQPPHSLPGNPMQSSPSLQQAQSQANHLLNQGLIPPRTIPTPQQQPQAGQHHPTLFSNGLVTPGGPFSNNNSQQPQAGPSQSNMPGTQGNMPGFPQLPQGTPPLDKSRFEPAYKSFCSKRNLKIDGRLLSIENRPPVDLHALHVHVIQEGGFAQVEGKDLWPVIGGKLGFVNFPGTGSEPARCGPGVAQKIQHIYKEYLYAFDAWYISQAIESRNNRGMQMATNSLQAQMVSLRWTPQQMQNVIAMANLSVAELHARGVDEQMIRFVETNRATLQRTFQEQRTFHLRMRGAQPPNQNGAQMPEQNPGDGRPGMVGQAPPFGPGSAQNQQPHNAAIALANRQQQQIMQQQLMQQQQQQAQQQQSMNGLPGGMRPQGQMQGVAQMPNFAGKTNANAYAQAVATISKLKHEYNTIHIPGMPFVDVPVEQQVEYNQLLEQVHRQCNETESKLPMVIVLVKQEDIVRRLVMMITVISHQRSLLSGASGAKYIVTFDLLRNMAAEQSRVMESFANSLSSMRNQSQQAQAHQMMQQQHLQQQQQQQQQHQQMVNNLMVPPMPGGPQETLQQQSRPHRPPSALQQHTPQQQPSNLNQPARPPVSLQPPPIKRKQQPSGSGAVSTPSPAPVASASTPVASAPTPTAIASSPAASNTKSPKNKAAAKPKSNASAAKARRVSKVVPPPLPTPAPAESSLNNGKRSREEEHPLVNGSSVVADEPSPPKRVKTEWEAEPSEALLKKNEDVKNIKSDEEATVFFEQMTELIKQGDMTEDISETLEAFLKGCGPDALDGLTMGGPSSGNRESSPPPASLGATESFDEFFDFSFGTVEDEDSNSKAPTPDLISSSSTNPSPESNHEAEPGHMLSSTSSSTMDIRTEETSDLLRLGTLKEIDGGEAAYYQSTEWKWDSPMATLDQPWAIFNS